MTVENFNIEIPEETLSSEEQEQANEVLKELGAGEPEQVEDKPESAAETVDDELGPEHDDKTEEEREAIRARRRKERLDKKNFRKEKEDSYRREIAGLKRQLDEVNQWKNVVERRNNQSGAAQLEHAIRETDDTLEVAKRALQEATTTQNGEALVDAQELYYAARKRKEDLERIKAQVAQNSQRQQRPTIDPTVAKKAQDWMVGKDWYNPQGTNKDSKITMMIDAELNEEGWDPRTEEYWGELDERVKKYLPHRYSDSKDEAPQTPPIRPKPPTGGNGGGNRNSNSSFTLSPERVRAMKEAGLWDDIEKRKTMTRRYMEQDKKK